jgi:nitroreductase
MEKKMGSKFRRFLNPILAISFIVLAASGIALLCQVWIDWVRELHEVSSILFVLAGLIHVVINGKSLLLSLKGFWTLVITGVVLLAILLPILHEGSERVSRSQTVMDLADISLPAPRREGGKPLMQVLNERKSSRSFTDKKLPSQVVSDLLWAAFGINRADGKRTAPSTRNWQEVEIYTVTAEGVYLYDPAANRLRAVIKGDLRRVTGIQGFVATAPLNLVYVADHSKAKGASGDDWTLYSAADTAFISQNVYLFCASEGLATVVRGAVDRKALAAALKLPEHKKVILTQTVGYPGTEGK